MDASDKPIIMKHATDVLLLISGIVGVSKSKEQRELMLAQAFPNKKPIQVRGHIVVELDPGDAGSSRADLRGVTKLIPDLEYTLVDPVVWLELDGPWIGMRFFSGPINFPTAVFVLKAPLDPQSWRPNLTTRGSGFFVRSAEGWIKLGFA
jgi:hypothetical protein